MPTSMILFLQVFKMFLNYNNPGIAIKATQTSTMLHPGLSMVGLILDLFFVLCCCSCRFRNCLSFSKMSKRTPKKYIPMYDQLVFSIENILTSFLRSCTYLREIADIEDDKNILEPFLISLCKPRMKYEYEIRKRTYRGAL